jgi:DNA-binding beta-propeller fold protein YncE
VKGRVRIVRRQAIPGGTIAITVLFGVVSAAVVSPARAETLALENTVTLASVQGRLDHLSIDVEGGRLFVAALGADSIEVIDLRAGQRVARIERLREPQGVLYLPDERRLIVANGAGGGVQAFADVNAPPLASAAALDDADNLRFDRAAGHVIAGYAQALAMLDPKTMQQVQRVALPGHPEAFEAERMGQRIYVNVPSAGQIAVVDRASGQVAAAWAIDNAAQNYPMALDEADHRLFVATRRPALLLVYDTSTGKRTAELPLCGDADDLFFDEPRRQVYAICGEGFVEIVRQRDADHYEVVERIPTSKGARTGLFVPELSTLFAAVPARGHSPAEVRAYRLK